MNRGLSLAKGWGDRTARLSLTLAVALTSRGCQAGRRTPLPEHLGAHSAHSQDLAPSRLSFLAPSPSSLLCGHRLASGSLSTPPPQNAVPGGRAACWSRVSRVAHVHPLVLDPRAPRVAAERPNAPLPDPGFRSSASPSGPPWAKAPRFPRAHGDGNPCLFPSGLGGHQQDRPAQLQPVTSGGGLV